MSVLTDPASWPLEPPLAVIVLAGVLFRLGGRRRASTRHRFEHRWRGACFYAGLLALALALDSPIDAYDDRLLWVHMTQHMLLTMVAPPLLVLGRPWLRVWQPLPLGARRSVAKTLARAPALAPLRRTAPLLLRPLPAWILANGVLVVWHVPALYDATVRSSTIHDLEHALLLTTSLLLWLNLLDSPPLHARLDHVHRAAYATGALAVGWVLAIVLAFSPAPIYSAYAELGSRPGGISALADQQLAAGVLWVPGAIAYVVAAIVNVYCWLAPEEAGTRRTRRAPVFHAKEVA